MIDLFPSFEVHDRLARGGAGWLHEKDYFMFVSLTQVRVFRLNGVEFSFSLNNDSPVIFCNCNFGGIITLHEDSSITLVTELETLFKPKHRPKVMTFKKISLVPSNVLALSVCPINKEEKTLCFFLSFLDGSLIKYSINLIEGNVVNYNVISLNTPAAKLALSPGLLLYYKALFFF